MEKKLALWFCYHANMISLPPVHRQWVFTHIISVMHCKFSPKFISVLSEATRYSLVPDERFFLAFILPLTSIHTDFHIFFIASLHAQGTWFVIVTDEFYATAPGMVESSRRIPFCANLSLFHFLSHCNLFWISCLWISMYFKHTARSNSNIYFLCVAVCECRLISGILIRNQLENKSHSWHMEKVIIYKLFKSARFVTTKLYAKEMLPISTPNVWFCFTKCHWHSEKKAKPKYAF